MQGESLFFADGKSRIDHVLVWCSKTDEREDVRKNIRRVFEQNLEEEGLRLEHDMKVLFMSFCHLFIYLFIHRNVSPTALSVFNNLQIIPRFKKFSVSPPSSSSSSSSKR